MSQTRTLIIMAIATSQLLACGVTHIGEYVPKRRAYESPVNLDAQEYGHGERLTLQHVPRRDLPLQRSPRDARRRHRHRPH